MRIFITTLYNEAFVCTAFSFLQVPRQLFDPPADPPRPGRVVEAAFVLDDGQRGAAVEHRPVETQPLRLDFLQITLRSSNANICEIIQNPFMMI